MSEQSPAGTAQQEQPPPEPAAPITPSEAALARYRSRMRRNGIVYYALIAVILAGVGTWVGVAWSRGEAAHASLHTFTPTPPTLGVEAPSQDQREVWRTSDRIALGVPQYGGTVVTYGRHTMSGHDVRTGKRTWYYTRTDREVCSAAQLTGTAIAIFNNGGNCDEVSAFDSDSGRRRWTRTLNMDGMPVDGQPSYQITPYTLLVATPAVIYALDPITGYNRWTYERTGCQIGSVALGSAGALISQTCTPDVECKDVKFCGVGAQLLLRDGSAGRDEDDKKNPDKIKWNLIGDADTPVSADEVISSLDSTGQTLHVRDAAKGSVRASLNLKPASAEVGPITAYTTDSAEVIWLSGVVYAVRPNASKPQWSTESPAPPTVMSTTNESTPNLSTARITVPTDSGIGIIDGNDGKVIQSFTVQPPAAGSVVYSLGSGFLVAGPNGIVAYQ